MNELGGWFLLSFRLTAVPGFLVTPLLLPLRAKSFAH
jgi:hypothetical protein